MIGNYIIKEARVKNGHTKHYIHNEVEGRECFIVELEKGERALLKYKPDYDVDYHRLHTSTVLDYTVSEDGNDVVIETLNTVYYLVRSGLVEETEDEQETVHQ